MIRTSVGNSSTQLGRQQTAVWAAFVTAALLLLDILGLTSYGWVIPLAVLALAALPAARPGYALLLHRAIDLPDLIAIGSLYALVVMFFRLAFTVFTADRVTGLFMTFASGLVAGVAGPVIYTVWIRRRSLATLGLNLHKWRQTLVLGLLFAGVQFSITLWGYRLPRPVDWVPLLVMAVTVGFFEAIFFRGFIQGRLEESFGAGPAILGAAALYSLYHVGYGMAGGEMLFLFGLGVVYAVAYRLVQNIFVLWPLLTPLGSFFSQLRAGDLAGKLPWLSIAGFADVFVVMVVVIWLAARKNRHARL